LLQVTKKNPNPLDSDFYCLARLKGLGLVATPQSRGFDFGFALLLGQARL
jgi:hypothetical protein